MTRLERPRAQTQLEHRGAAGTHSTDRAQTTGVTATVERAHHELVADRAARDETRHDRRSCQAGWR